MLAVCAACGRDADAATCTGAACSDAEQLAAPEMDAGADETPRSDLDAAQDRDARAEPPPEPADAAQPPDAGACGLCTAYAPPGAIAQVQAGELAELSGLAVSWKNPDIFFAHNDRNRATIYAIDRQGELHARFVLEQAMATDPEDVAVGPCAAGSCVYLADIGDNAAVRGEYAILRFAEPSVPSSPGDVSSNVAFERLRFSYEDGSHNDEGLLVAPSGALYVVTKGSGPSSVYRLPAEPSTSALNQASKVATLPVPAASDMAASAAAAHPCGLGFLVRTYDRVYEFRATSGDFESAFAATPQVVAMPSEPQSEGISYLADGRGFVSAGEGAAAPIVETRCR
jgi:hypothetical protein